MEQWRAAVYPGVTTVTRRLLEHWHDQSARTFPFYFCQLEAIETLIWCVEGAAEYRQGIAVPGDGGAWQRLCNKMATGTGKTTDAAESTGAFGGKKRRGKALVISNDSTSKPSSLSGLSRCTNPKFRLYRNLHNF